MTSLTSRKGAEIWVDSCNNRSISYSSNQLVNQLSTNKAMKFVIITLICGSFGCIKFGVFFKLILIILLLHLFIVYLFISYTNYILQTLIDAGC